MSSENNEYSNQNSDEQKERVPFHFRRVQRKKKPCAFCADKNFKINLKEPLRLRKYISERAKILPRRVTGTCAEHQRYVALMIKRARNLALLPYIGN